MFSFENNNRYDYLIKDKQFIVLRSYEERVKYVLQNVKPLPEYIREISKKADIYHLYHKKSLNNSRSFRKEGEYYFERKRYKLAKMCFSFAILSAPFSENCHLDGKQELSLCYALRSKVFFEMKCYDSALFDANQSIILSESEEMICHKINCLLFANQIKEMNQFIDDCIKRLDNKEIEESENLRTSRLKTLKIVKIDDKKSEEITIKESKETLNNLWIHSSVQLKNSKEKGRHLVAKDNIPANSVIIIEKPFSVIYFGENIFEFCSYCGNQIGDQIWPCPQCNEVVFCDQKCGQRAMTEFHRFECGIIGLIFNLGSNVLQFFRNFSDIGSKHSTKDIMNCINHKELDVLETYIKEETQFTNSETKDNQKLSKLELISNLLEHSDNHTEYEWISNTFCAIETTLLLHYRQLLDSDIIHSIEYFASFAKIVCNLLNGVSINVFGLFQSIEEESAHVANCLCFFSAMTNHSCDPNTNWYFDDKYICFETKTDIKSEEEITISYGPELSSPLIERQIKLKESYYFDCKCKPCLQSVRTVLSLKCHTCDGPVIYIIGTDSNSCQKCGTIYSKMKETIKTVDTYSSDLKRIIENIAKDNQKNKWLESAQNNIEKLNNLVYKLSPQLLEPIRKFIKLCLHFSKLKIAIDLSKYLLPSIELQTNDYSNIFCDIFDDLFLLTRLYYNYLIKNQFNDNEWQTGLRIYVITIDLLEKVKNKKLLNQNQESISTLNDCIENFKQESQHLKQLFDCLKAKEVNKRVILESKSRSLSSDDIDLETSESVKTVDTKDMSQSIDSMDSSEEFVELFCVDSSDSSDDFFLDEENDLFSSSQSSVISVPSLESRISCYDLLPKDYKNSNENNTENSNIPRK